jgi:uncharacterized damage-inducible protein DinB
MAIVDALLPEFDHEMANTRKVLERVPDDRLGWRPHPKSYTMGELATHVARLPTWATMTVQHDELDMAPGGKPLPREAEAKSRAELLSIFDESVKKARPALASTSDAAIVKNWSLKSNGATLLSMPRIAVLRGFVMNHSIHHRAQLGVYLRLNDIPVPALYGPSADEQAGF